MTETKSDYETKYSLGQQVVVKKGFYKNTKATIQDVQKVEEEYLYTLGVHKDNKFKNKAIDKIQVREVNIRIKYFFE